MDDISTEHHKLVKVTHADFEAFLLKQSNEFWDVDGEAFADIIGHRPLTVDELLRVVEVYGGGSEYVYIFGNDDPLEIASSVDWNDIPQVGLDELPDFVVTWVDGNDFLNFACSEEEASNGKPAVLLTWKSQELDDDEVMLMESWQL